MLELVVLGVGAGHVESASTRLMVLDEVRPMEANAEAAEFTERLRELGVVPRMAAEDAVHIVIAVTKGADYLVIWSF